MINGIDKLKPLKNEDWHKVRDISIPIHKPAGSSAYEADIKGALCFAGSPHAMRLCDTENSASIVRAVEVMRQANVHLSKGHHRFRLDVENMSFRVQLGNNASSQDLQLRVLPQECPSVHDLDLPPPWRALVMDEALLMGGLILITAPNGQGKTTSASAIVRSRLEAFGGMANTIEDPIELPLQHAWGEGGVCYQRPVTTPSNASNSGEGYYMALFDALRQFPAISGGGTILFVGEIRDAKTAAETLKAAANGHLVIATMHGKSVETSIRRMMTLSSDASEGMEPANVREMLSECLRMVINQRLFWKLEGEGWSAAKVKGDLVWSRGYESPVANAIRRNSMDALTAIANSQSLAISKMRDDVEVNIDQLKETLHRTASASAGIK